MSPPGLKLLFLGALVEQLGAQLYPSATATVAELISNCWDADARHAWITIPLDKAWTPDDRVVVIDDGHGMNRGQAQAAYLRVGRKRRVEAGATSESGLRQVHGRKGIGKLAAFGTARILECLSVRDGQKTSFRLDYDGIRACPPGAEYPVQKAADTSPLLDPDGKSLSHGTRIVLSQMRLKKPVPQEQFMRSMSRRFSLNAAEMLIVINGEPLSKFQSEVAYRFPRDGVPAGVAVTVDDEGWGTETMPDGNLVRWWIGFTEKPLKDESMRGVSVIAKGKMAQRPFMFGKSQGTEGQLGQEYLVGEVEADWIDQGTDIDDDLIQSNRDQIQTEDDRLQVFLDWGRGRLRWALSSRQKLVEETNIRSLELSPGVQDRLKSGFTPSEQRVFQGIASRLAKLPEMGPEDLTASMLELLDAHSDKAVRNMIESIAETDPDKQDVIWGLVSEFGLIDARRQKSIIEARIEVIEKLRKLVKGGAKEVPDIHQHLRENYWLLDPRWQLMDDEVELTKLLEKQFGLGKTDAEGQRLDFVYCLAPRTPAQRDVVFLIEIKRGTGKDGKPHKVTVEELHKFHQYYTTLDHALGKADTHRPRLHAIMIASDYATPALATKSSYEKLGLEFKSWHSVLDDTRRLHLGWLKLSDTRIGAEGGGSPGGLKEKAGKIKKEPKKEPQSTRRAPVARKRRAAPRR